LYIQSARDKATQSKRKTSLHIEVKLSIEKEEAKERVQRKDSVQSRIDALLLPTILRSLRGSASSKDRYGFDGFDSLLLFLVSLNIFVVFCLDFDLALD
jgi:hypothetical protein